ncbi:M23 family metallopeptidase [Bradyrhizobium cenepequi]|uniref:M23 family metallopeptidase n=1 Tax=Bradyrhizobium cenepequi TaxID=2821403 RepID=UPI001CE269C8|nr:M23 family metallopeptidase [Bradyrhizobium cenepequi]
MRAVLALAAAIGFACSARAENIELGLPVGCEIGQTCYIQNYVDDDPSQSSRDYKCGTLTYDRHNGTDFRVPSLAAQRSGVDVLASASGRVLRARDGVPDAVGKPAREAVRDVECGNGIVIEHPGGWETQYCHMANGSLAVKPGDDVARGQRLGRIGLSGLTEYPHLHFTVRYRGAMVDPFAYGAAPGSCGGGESLWQPAFRAQLAYQDRAVLNAGFMSGPPTMELIEEARADEQSLSANSPALVAFVRAIGLKAGDVQGLVIKDPQGQVLAENRAAPLQSNKAQYMLFAGKKRPPNGWDHGTYKATYTVERDGKVVLEKRLELAL